MITASGGDGHGGGAQERPDRWDRRRALTGMAAVVVVSVAGLRVAHLLGEATEGPAEPFGPRNLATVVTVMLALLVAHLQARRLGRCWADYGLGSPRSWWKVALGGIAAAAAVTLTMALLVPVVRSLAPAPPDVSHLVGVRGDPVAYAAALLSAWITAAFAEELIFRGFLLNEAAAVLGGARWSWLAGVVVVAALFGSAHAYQGAAGVLITGTVGLLFGLLYLVARRNLWVLVVAHGVIDTLSLTQIFLS